VVAELLEAGARGACVDLGGDLRAAGDSPNDDGGWTVALEDPWGGDDLARVGLSDGAVATSSVLRRRWTSGGQARHHLIDPRTGRPAETSLVQVTVVAG